MISDSDADPRHHACQQQHGEIGLVAAHVGVAQRLDLVARRRQAHDALAVHGTGGVHVAPRQREDELVLHYIRSKPSWQIVIASTATSFEPAFIAAPVYLDGHAERSL